MKEIVPYIDAAAVEIVKAKTELELEKALTWLLLVFPIKRAMKAASNRLDPVSRIAIFKMGRSRELPLEAARQEASDLLYQIRKEEMENEE